MASGFQWTSSGYSSLKCPDWLHKYHTIGVFDFGEALVDEWLGLSRPALPLSVDDGDFENASVTFTFPSGNWDLDRSLSNKETDRIPRRRDKAYRLS